MRCWLSERQLLHVQSDVRGLMLLMVRGRQPFRCSRKRAASAPSSCLSEPARTCTIRIAPAISTRQPPALLTQSIDNRRFRSKYVHHSEPLRRRRFFPSDTNTPPTGRKSNLQHGRFSGYSAHAQVHSQPPPRTSPDGRVSAECTGHRTAKDRL